MKVKIVSGWSNPGGSTTHHINLTNLLNDNGYDCTFYGPHDWHKDKCKSASIQECRLDSEDILISHFIQLPPANVKKHILSCHETNLFPLRDILPQWYDLIHFVSNYKRIGMESITHSRSFLLVWSRSGGLAPETIQQV